MILWIIYLIIIFLISQNVCMDRMCMDPIEKGPCNMELNRYAFNKKTNKCEKFVYGGCGNSRNVFDTIELCKRICIINTYQDINNKNFTMKTPFWKEKRNPKIHEKSYPTIPGAHRYNIRCRLPMAVGKCRNFLIRWYFDSKSASCKPFRYGGCGGNSNRFDNIFECEKACSGYIRDPADIPTSMCSQHRTIGQCTNYEIRWYYLPDKEECRQFVYGGCGGNLNNFKSKATCEQNCKLAPKLPTPKQHRNPDCILSKNVGQGNANLKRYHYVASKNNCVEFIYKGAKGNNNNFELYFECMIKCSNFFNDMGTSLAIDDMLSVANIGYF